MTGSFGLFRRGWLRLIAILAMIALPLGAAQAMKFYVDNALGVVKPEEKVTPAAPQPVQVLFEFQRDGSPHARATKQVKPWALEAIKATGDFSEVTEAPTANGAVLSVKFNNVVKKEELDKAKSDGFKAGLGFGLFGGVFVTDTYEVSFEYIAATGAAPIKSMVIHKLHSTYGKQKAGFVAPGTEYKKANDAVKAVVDQALARGVNNIVADPAFPR
jgi:hypothetical protein